MRYQFPIIKTIDDVLPAIAGKKEFIVAERPDYTVINYTVAFSDTFSLDDDKVDNHGTMIPAAWVRRECRGIIFDKNGKLISRSFHKFFNIGERAETKTRKLKMGMDHMITEKMDGSMIRPLVLNGKVHLGTKMGLTEVAEQAEQVADDAARNYMLDMVVNKGATPIFEFVSPENCIVVKYKEPRLVLLTIRDNETGQYWTREAIENSNPPVDIVPQYGKLNGNLDEYVGGFEEQEDREGDVIHFADGHMVKIKTSWYLRIHRVKDQIQNNRRILDLIINNGIDDLIPNLDEDDYNRIVAFDKAFHEAYNRLVDRLVQVAVECKVKATMPNEFFDGDDEIVDRKQVAVELLPASGIDPRLYGHVFGYLDGKDVRETFLDRVRKSTNTTKKYNEMARILGIEESEDDQEDKE